METTGKALLWVIGIGFFLAIIAYWWNNDASAKERLADRLYADGVKLGKLEQGQGDLRLATARLIQGQNDTDKATARLIANYGCLRSNLDDLGSFQIKDQCCD